MLDKSAEQHKTTVGETKGEDKCESVGGLLKISPLRK